MDTVWQKAVGSRTRGSDLCFCEGCLRHSCMSSGKRSAGGGALSRKGRLKAGEIRGEGETYFLLLGVGVYVNYGRDERQLRVHEDSVPANANGFGKVLQLL